MKLIITPKISGEICVKNLRYLLFGVFPTYFPLKKRFTRHGKPVEEDIVLDIRPPMPVLNITIKSLPDSLIAGQVFKTSIAVTNTGGRDLCGLKIILSHPHMFYFGEDSHSDSDMQDSPDFIHSKNSLENSSLLNLDLAGSGGILKVEETAHIPLRIRGEEIGLQNCKFIFGYCAAVILLLIFRMMINHLFELFASNNFLKSIHHSRFLRSQSQARTKLMNLCWA